MNIQQLRYLVAAADTGSLSAAARANRVSQPVVSRALHGLEREYRLLLFRRRGRSMILTDAGQEVVASARRALEAIDEIDTALKHAALGGALVVASTTTHAALMGPIVREYLAHNADAALRLRRADAVDVLRMVDEGEADLGFGDLPKRAPGPTLVLDPIWHAEVVLVSPPGTDLPASVSYDDMTRARLILPAIGRGRDVLEHFSSSVGGRPLRPAVETDVDDLSVWIPAAQSGAGSFISYRAVAVDIDGIEIRPLDPPMTTTAGFVYRAGSLSSEGRALLDIAKRCPIPAGCRAAVSASSV